MIYRNLDGIYFRIYRDEKWQDICFTDLLNDEVLNVIRNRNEEWFIKMYEELERVLNKIVKCINSQEVDNATCVVLNAISTLTPKQKLFTIKNVIRNLADYYDITNVE